MRNKSLLEAKGYTLIELMVVIGIISVFAGVSFPALSQWIPAYRLKGNVQALYADFQRAKLHAVKTNRDVTFNFTAAADCSGSTGYTFTDAEGTRVASKTMEGDICVFDSDFDNDSSGFDPRGFQAENPPVQRTVKIKHVKISREYQITQSMAGSIALK